ncbi:hypothetical protein ACFO0M_01590 [Micromonospora mangrovi]|uniref:Acetoacetate decarboxylase n=2 Tax=Micromonospora TaxID=1873 RepID=A0AAU7MG95_9ACTN
MLDPAAPQLVVNARVLLLSWLPADPDAVAAFVPAGLRPHPDRQVFLCQYEVDDESQTSGFGAYSLTYLGVSLADLDLPGADTPSGWWTHYLASSPLVRDYAAARGAPAVAGWTGVDVRRGELSTETRTADGTPLIRVRGRAGQTTHVSHSGHHRYLTARNGELLVADYPYVAEPVSPFEIESVEFLAPEHSAYPLRPGNPLTIARGFYSPRMSFAYPAQRVLDGAPTEPVPAHHVPARRARSGLPSGS